MKKLSYMKDAITLFIITMLSGLLLGGVYEITKAPIALAKENAKQAAYKSVYPQASAFVNADTDADRQAIASCNEALSSMDFGKVFINEVAFAVDAAQSKLGFVITATSKDGYGGDVKISVSIDKEGTIGGIAYLTLAETPGLGMRAKDAPFYSQYSGKNAQMLTVVKNGSGKPDEIDAISGATVTSKAVTGAVNAALYYVQQNKLSIRDSSESLTANAVQEIRDNASEVKTYE